MNVLANTLSDAFTENPRQMHRMHSCLPPKLVQGHPLAMLGRQFFNDSPQPRRPVSNILPPHASNVSQHFREQALDK